MKDDVPIKGEILFRHSGGPEREWNSEHKTWLYPDDHIVRDEHGDLWFVKCYKLAQ